MPKKPFAVQQARERLKKAIWHRLGAHDWGLSHIEEAEAEAEIRRAISAFARAIRREVRRG